MFSFVPFHYQTAEKGLDLNVLWRPRHSASAAKKNDAVAAPVAPSRGVTSTFKRWRRSGGDRHLATQKTAAARSLLARKTGHSSSSWHW